MKDGWVKVYRKVQDNWLWHKGPFSYGQAWIDLIMLANRKPGYIFVRGVQIPIQRGQVGMSILSMADRWMWSRKAVETFLNRLEIAQQIEQQKNRISSVITILNYEDYQGQAQQTEQQESNSGAAGEQQESTNKKERSKEVKKETLGGVSGAFEEFWKIYPRKVAKSSAEKAWSKIKDKDNILSEIIIALEWQKQTEEWIKEGGKFVPYPATYLNQQRWMDEPSLFASPPKRGLVL